MKNLILHNGHMAIVQTNVIMIIFTTDDKRTLTTTVTNLSLFQSMTDTNVKVCDDCIILIDSNTCIPLTEICDSNFIILLLYQIELMQREILHVKRCIHETSKVNAISICDNIPLNSFALFFHMSDVINVHVADNNVTININQDLKFNNEMTHVLCSNITFDKSFVLNFDWNNLPDTIENININNNFMLASYINNMCHMNIIPRSVKLYNVKLNVSDLDIMVKYKPKLDIYYNDKLIKYERVNIDQEE